MDKFSDQLHELGLHYNHYVSPSVRGHLVKMLMTLDPHMVYFDHNLQSCTCQHSLTTGMQKHLFGGRGFAKHQSSLLWSISKNTHKS